MSWFEQHRRRTIGGFHPKYQAVLNYATANAISHPSGAQNIINNTIVASLDALGYWDECELFYFFRQESGTEDFCRINWADPSNYYLQNVNYRPPHVANQGFTTGPNLGSGAPAFDTGFNLLNDRLYMAQGNGACLFKPFNIPTTYVTQTTFCLVRSGSDYHQILLADNGSTNFLPRMFANGTFSISPQGTAENKHWLSYSSGSSANAVYIDGVFHSIYGGGGSVGSYANWNIPIFGSNPAGTITPTANTGAGLEYIGFSSLNNIAGNQANLYNILS